MRKSSFLPYVKSFAANIRYIDKYVRGGLVLGDNSQCRRDFFDSLMSECGKDGKKCLQIGARGAKFGENWVSVDLFDKSPLIDFNYDLRALQFEDNSFDAAVCNAVLEHVDDPPKAISELYRVLKSGAKIWVEVPLNQPYHPSPNDYWRVTPEGMRIWMRDFREISCGGFLANKSFIYNGVYFFGEKE